MKPPRKSHNKPRTAEQIRRRAIKNIMRPERGHRDGSRIIPDDGTIYGLKPVDFWK